MMVGVVWGVVGELSADWTADCNLFSKNMLARIGDSEAPVMRPFCCE